LLLLLAFGALFSFGCTAEKHSDPEAARRVTPAAQTGDQQAASLGNKKPDVSAMPARTEVNEAIQRVYLGAVAIDSSASPAFIPGDFNGDGSQDLVVRVKPVNGALVKLNSEYANWIVEDPRTIILPDPQKAVQKLPKPPARPSIEPDDLLLLVLHGYREEGWRHPFARQTFLLKNSVGENLHRQASNETSNASGEAKAIPKAHGDVIIEKLAGHDGFLYWTGAKYAWHE
jgi:hypothetical protein